MARMNVFGGNIPASKAAHNYNQIIKQSEQAVIRQAGTSAMLMKRANAAVNKMYSAIQKAQHTASKRHTASMARMKRRK